MFICRQCCLVRNVGQKNNGNSNSGIWNTPVAAQLPSASKTDFTPNLFSIEIIIRVGSCTTLNISKEAKKSTNLNQLENIIDFSEDS